jgi:cAMP-dependent protein kinase regulator
MAAKDTVDAGATIPRLPLFGELEPPLLARLLAVQQVKEAAAEQSLIEQGEEGSEAFVLARGVANVVRQDASSATVLAALGPGAVFGEMALVSRAPRGASVVAVEPVQVLVMARDDLEQLAQQEMAIARELGRFCHGRLVSNLVRHSSILSAVHPARREELVTGFQARSFEPGDVVVKQGQEAAGLFIIASGAVQVSSEDADGESVVLAELGPGEVVGEIGLVLRRPATADVVALHPTVALELSSERFHEVVREHPGLIGELYELAIKREAVTRNLVAQQALEAEDVVIL